MRLVAPFGFYGMGNTGDEGTLCGFARLLALEDFNATVSIGAGNPAHTARVEPAFRYFAVSGNDPRRWWAKLRGTAQAVIGGTPIMDVLGDWPLRDLVPLLQSAQRRGLPFAFIGCGIEELRLEQSRRVLRDEVIPRVQRWSVRSGKDAARLTEAGVPADQITVAADLAWLIEVADDDGMNRRIDSWGLDVNRPWIGVNVCNENRCLERNPAMTDALARALDVLADRYDARIVFICAEIRDAPEFDRSAAELIRARMTRKSCATVLPSDYLSPAEMMTLLGRCSLVFTMRYHVCLLSSIRGIPFIGLERSDKIADLCWDLNWQARLTVPFSDAEMLVAQAESMLANRDSYVEHLRLAIEPMRRRALRNRLPLDALLRAGA